MPPDPGKNWLDRLRSSRGFPPISAEFDLDQFLLLPDSNPRSDPRDDAAAASCPEKNSEKEGETSGEGRTWIEIVGGALAELFRMEDPSGRREARGGLKNPRKQSKPRVFEIAGDEAEDAEEKIKSSRRKMAGPPSSGGGSDSTDLSDYSRTEVTVIDTSSSSWKSQKIIFRKESVWKIRDKKPWIVSKKKRKLSAVKKSASEEAPSYDKSTSVEICSARDRTVLAEDASACKITRYARRKHLQRSDRRSSAMDCSSPASESSS